MIRIKIEWPDSCWEYQMEGEYVEEFLGLKEFFTRTHRPWVPIGYALPDGRIGQKLVNLRTVHSIDIEPVGD